MTDTRPFPTLRRDERPKRRRIASLLEYDGAGFHGFQRQPDQRTVEGELIECLLGMGLTGGLGFASRTDTGVHAHGQVVCFNVDSQADLTEVTQRLRTTLPSDIRLRALTWALPKFHPRWTATGKRYVYTLARTSEVAGTANTWPIGSLDLDAFGEAVSQLRSAPELTGFTAAGGKLGKMPPLTGLELQDTGTDVRLIFEGPAFARYAIRHMVGCAVAQSQKLVEHDTCARVALEPGPYRGLRAPPQGLILEEVFYPLELDPFAASG